MINPRISAVWNTIKPIAAFSCTPRVQEVHTKAEVVHLAGYYSIVTHRKSIAKHMINPRIRVQEVHTKAEVVHLIIQLSRLGNVLRNI